MRLLNATAQTTLNGAINASTTSLTIVPVGGSPSTATPNFRIWLDSEMMIVTAVSGGSNQNYTVIRGAEGTTAAAHSSGAIVLYPLVGAGQPRDGIKAGIIYELVAQNSAFVTITDIPNKILAITIIIDGGGSVITTGVKCDVEVPFDCTINRATLLADQSGSMVIDIWKDTYANYPPIGTDSITASAKPTLSSATKSQDSTLTGWTTSVSAGDVLRFNVDSASTITRVTLSLKVTKTP